MWHFHCTFEAKGSVIRHSLVRIGRRGLGVALALVGSAMITGAVVAAGNLRDAGAYDFSSRGSAATSCFLGHVPHLQARAIEAATVFIALVGADGSLLSQGTGFIVAPSGTEPNGARRIVTAAHVLAVHEAMPEGTRFMIFFSDGRPLGVPRTIATGPLHTISVGGFDVVADDIALLEIAQYTDKEAQARLSAIAGLPVDSDDTLRVGEASEPVGAVWGFSGAAAVNREGHVIGVLTGADFRGHVTVEIGSIQETNAAGHVVARPVTLPSRSLVVIEPISAPNLRHELGLAEGSVTRDAKAEIVLTGFPMTSCASTTSVVDAADSTASVALLSKWQNIGQTGAWLLPPHFSNNKLKLERP
jgi:hypothetical protein